MTNSILIRTAVVVSSGVHIENISLISHNLNKYLDINKIIIICPEEYLKQSIKNKKYQVIYYNENFLFRDLNIKSIEKILENKSNRKINYQANKNWYFQQLLKYASCHIIQDDYYLLWDADTLPVRKFDLCLNNKIVLKRGKENPKQYLEFCRKFYSIKYPKYSFISQHMVINKTHLLKILNEFNSISNQPWFVNLLNCLPGKNINEFSEYEFYARYCLFNFPNEYIIEHASSWFRYGNSYFNKKMNSFDAEKLSDVYDFISYENWDYGIIRSLRAKIMVFYDRFK